MKILLYFSCLCFLVGCASGSKIPAAEYSALQTPDATYEFAKRSISKGDPEAFYHCLSTGTKEQVSLSLLKIGWGLGGRVFSLVLESKIKEVTIPAPEYSRRNDTAKLTLANNDLEASILLLQEEDQWRFVYPSPYPLPDLSKIQAPIRYRWRTEGIFFEQKTPKDWLASEKKNTPKKTPKNLSRPKWRTEG